MSGDHDDFGDHKKKGEEGEGPWLVSYADLMTLLMGFFALISSFSSVKKEEFEKVKASAADAFGGEYAHPYEAIGKEVEKYFADRGITDIVAVKTTLSGVEITFSGRFLFESGSYQLLEEAKTLMQDVSKVVKDLDKEKKFKVLIEGHTDSTPISHQIISSNWELSGMRASRVAQMFQQQGFAKQDLTIIGWGDTRPTAKEDAQDPKDRALAKAKNRRVVVLVYDKDKRSDPITR